MDRLFLILAFASIVGLVLALALIGDLAWNY